MQFLKDLYTGLDITISAYWGFTTLELINAVMYNSATIVFSTVDNVIKLLFALVGLIYTIIKMHHFYHKSKLERAKLKEELEQIERLNEKV